MEPKFPLGQRAPISHEYAEVVYREAGPAAPDQLHLLWTAPHAILLKRDNSTTHLPEDFTTFLAEAFAVTTQSSAIMWSNEQHLSSYTDESAELANRDPNYLLWEECTPDRNPWNAMMAHHQNRAAGAYLGHIDVHGRKDPVPGTPDASDCDLGLGAVRRYWGDEQADRLLALLHAELCGVLPQSESGAFVVNQRPRLQGCMWGKWCTLTQQSVSQYSMVAVQLELSYRLRSALAREPALRKSFALAVARAIAVFVSIGACPNMGNP